ncbi:pro-neuregulin-3, membrane-bound isoform isoform X1 [Corythoichthys intestinalis]|uniref:pro-neuregulin-3, membrane-bound isoform isoform X1 n=1 Tax=Corythoichthys intestinalis TaxID=161448 RepID=UPI0025A61D1C|nr:pro-neuregulin-3, membrane-bound isoform isoform X1 [Corythoichthys intestinalis]
MSRKEGPGRMSEGSGATGTGAVILEEPEPSGTSGASGARGEGPARHQGPLGCALWPRQQTWLCAVPLLIGFIGLGLSLMLLKWIVVGTVRDYVPTDLVDANRIGQDPIFLSKPSGIPKGPETTTAASTPTAERAPKTVTVGKGRTRSGDTTTTTASPRAGGASGSLATPRNHGHRNGRVPPGYTPPPRTTQRKGEATSSPSPSNPTVLNDSTQMWTSERTTTGAVTTTAATHRHGRHKTLSPTVPPVRSEHFKPCHDKDLAYCLNGGECFVIETLSGPHKHCKCREGYQGIRCDQFLPKTDSILSDPNHLGIEFMEKKEVYQRQLLSITSIAMAIGLLGVLCVALYCRNKRRREKLQAHLKESRSGENYATNVTNVLYGKRNCKADIRMQQQYCKHPPACDSSFMPIRSSLKLTVEQRSLAARWSSGRKTPPISRGCAKAFGLAYQHLREAELTEREAEPPHGYVHQEAPRRMEPGRQVLANMQCGGGDSRRPASVLIIPSVRGRHDYEVSCMQTTLMSSNEVCERSAPERRHEELEARRPRVSARRRTEDGRAAPVGGPARAREIVCVLDLNVGGATHTQLLREPDQ